VLHESQHYAVFCTGASSWRTYTLGSLWNVAAHSCSNSVGWYLCLSQGILGGVRTRDILEATAVAPDVAEILEVVVQCGAARSSVCFDLYNSDTEVGKGEGSLWILRVCQDH